MKKIILFICCLCCFVMPLSAVEQHALDIQSKQMVVVNMNDSLTLYEKNTQDLIQLESMARLVLVITAIEQQAHYSEQKGGMAFEAALLEAVASKKGARILADAIFGEARMVELMNEKAAALNLGKTHFVNVDGSLDINQLTTVNELMQLLKEGMSYPEFQQLMNNGKASILKRCEELDLDCSTLTGGIFLNNAMLSVHQKNGLTLLCLSMNGADDKAYTDMWEATDYFYKHYQWVKIVSAGDEIANLPLRWGEGQDSLLFVSDSDYYALLPNNYNTEDLVHEVIKSETLSAPIEKEQYVGEYVVRYSGETVLTIPLFSNQQIDRSMFRYGFDMIKEKAVAHPIEALLGAVVIVIMIVLVWIRHHKQKGVRG